MQYRAIIELVAKNKPSVDFLRILAASPRELRGRED